MLCTADEIEALQDEMNFSLLLDVAHLRVSSNSLGQNFEEELMRLLPRTDYLHLSHTGPTEESNGGFMEDDDVLVLISGKIDQVEVITLEIYRELDELRRSFEIVENALGRN